MLRAAQLTRGCSSPCTALGMLMFSVRPLQERSSVLDSGSVRDFPNHRALHCLLGVTSLEMGMEITSPAEIKTSDLRERTLSWDKDDFGLNSFLCLRWTKATTAKTAWELAGCKSTQVQKYPCNAETEALHGQDTKHCGYTGSYLSNRRNHLERVDLIYGAWSQSTFCVLTIPCKMPTCAQLTNRCWGTGLQGQALFCFLSSVLFLQ